MNKLNIEQILVNLFIENKNTHFITDSIGGEKYTYGEFLNLSGAIRNLLVSKGIKKDDIVCYICENSVYTLALYIASLINGNIIAPIDCLKGQRETEEIIEMTKPTITLNLNDIKIEKNSNKFNINFSEIDFKKPYLLTFTSGTTSKPKGVFHSFENLVLSAYDFGNKFNFSDKNIFYHNFPMAYMAGILNMFIKPLIFGSKLVIGYRQSVQTALNFWNEIIKFNVNTFWFNPTFISILMKVDRGTLGSDYTKNKKITACIGTAPLDTELKLKFEEKYGFELYESYGLSETLFLTTNYPGSNTLHSPGEVLPSVKMVFDETGEIQVQTPWMLLKYLNSNEELHNSTFCTGDLGEIRNNKLFITGRKKDIIIKGGVNIAPKKIETYISHKFEEVVIIGLKDQLLGEKVACFYISKTFDENDKKDLNQNLLKDLGKDYVIDVFYSVDEIPKNINGKIDKLKLKSLYE